MSTTQFNTQTNTQNAVKQKQNVVSPADSIKAQFANAQDALRTDAFKNAFNNTIGKATQKIDIGAQMNKTMQQPRTVDNVNRVKNMMRLRDGKIAANPALAQYANDDITQAARLYTATPGHRDDVDYAAQIQQLAAMPVTAENKRMMQNLLAGRNAKIAAGGEPLAQYANDNITQMAQNYLKQYAPDVVDMSSYYDRADALADTGYSDVEASLQKQYDAQAKTIAEQYDRARRAADLNYAVNARNMENILAEQGLGRGLGAAPSSGYSETARMQALSNYANTVNDTYMQEQAAIRDLAAQMEAARMQAMLERNAAKQNSIYARADQANADRNFGFGVHQYNAGLESERAAQEEQKRLADLEAAYRDKVFDYGVQRDNVEDAFRNKQFDYGVQRDNVEDAFRREGISLDWYNAKNKGGGGGSGYVYDTDNPYEDAFFSLGGNVKRTKGVNDDGTFYEKEYLIR